MSGGDGANRRTRMSRPSAGWSHPERPYGTTTVCAGVAALVPHAFTAATLS